jgi:hypothetical protein
MRKKNKALTVLLFLLFFLFLLQSISAQPAIKLPKYTDYCALIRSESLSSTEVFRTKAFMSYSTVLRVDGGDTFFYSPKCNGGDNFSLVEFSALKDSNKKWLSFFNNLPGQKNFIFEVDFTGTAESSLLPVFGHLGWSRAEIKPGKINSIRDVSNRVKKPDYDAEKSIVERGTSLRDINVDALFSILLGNTYEPKSSVNISENFVLTDFAGNTFTKKQLSDFFARNPYGKRDDYPSWGTSINGGKATRINDLYKVTGFINFTDNQDKVTSLRYENFFEYKNENWLLNKSSLSFL